MLLVGKEVVMDNSSKDEYERIAEVYDLFKRDDGYKAFYELIKTTFLNSCEFLRPARTIEIGCGTGTFTSLFHTDGFNIIGTDISPNMLAIARKKYPSIPFEEMDIRTKQETGESFDLCFALDDVLNCMDNFGVVKDSLINIARLLSEDGYLLFDLVTLNAFHNYMGQIDFRRYEDACILSYPLFSLDNDGSHPFVMGGSVLTLDFPSSTWNRFDFSATEHFYSEQQVESALSEAGLSIVAKRGLVRGKLVAPDSLDADCIQKQLYLCKRGEDAK